MTQRKIMFRGLTVDKKEWVYGYYLTENHLGLIKHGIHFYDRLKGHDVAIEVLPETVGQYIEVDDKNGNKIFEGDILSHKDWHGGNFVVEWGSHVGKHAVGMVHGFEMPDNGIEPYEHEVIGNIHEKGNL